MENYILVKTDELYHHGILGQKWGIRRYQNKDGTLTAAGRKRLNLDEYENSHSEDFVIKKGTRATRYVSTPFLEDHKDTSIGGSEKKAKEYIDKVKKQESELDTKYVSIDGIRNKGQNGEDFYLSWFTDNGYNPDGAYLDEFKTKQDIKVASGKKVMEEVLNEISKEKLSTYLYSNNKDLRKAISLEYTTNKELFNKVNNKFVELGYNAIEDINDKMTDMPIILLDSKKSIGQAYNTKSGQQALDDYFKKQAK